VRLRNTDFAYEFIFGIAAAMSLRPGKCGFPVVKFMPIITPKIGPRRSVMRA